MPCGGGGKGQLRFSLNSLNMGSLENFLIENWGLFWGVLWVPTGVDLMKKPKEFVGGKD